MELTRAIQYASNCRHLIEGVLVDLEQGERLEPQQLQRQPLQQYPCDGFDVVSVLFDG